MPAKDTYRESERAALRADLVEAQKANPDSAVIYEAMVFAMDGLNERIAKKAHPGKSAMEEFLGIEDDPEQEKKDLTRYLSVLLAGEIILQERKRSADGTSKTEKSLFAGKDAVGFIKACGENKVLTTLAENLSSKLNKDDFEQSLADYLADRKITAYVEDFCVRAEQKQALKDSMAQQLKKNSDLAPGLERQAEQWKDTLFTLRARFSIGEQNVSFGSKEYDRVFKQVGALRDEFDLTQVLSEPGKWKKRFEQLIVSANLYLDRKKDKNGHLLKNLDEKTMYRVTTVQQTLKFAEEKLQDIAAAESALENIRGGRKFTKEELEAMDRSLLPLNKDPQARNVTHYAARVSKSYADSLHYRGKLNEMAAAVKAADKNVPLGTRVYDRAMNAVIELAENWKYTEEQVRPDEAYRRMKKASGACLAYLTGKGDPSKLSGTAKNRYQVILKAMNLIADRGELLLKAHPEIAEREKASFPREAAVLPKQKGIVIKMP